MSEGGGPLSNDDIITDMISEIKVEKTLLQNCIDEFISEKSIKNENANEFGFIDPQLIQKSKEQRIQEEEEESGNNFQLDQVQYNPESDYSEDASTLTEPAVVYGESKSASEIINSHQSTSQLQENNNLGIQTDDENNVSPSASELLNLSQDLVRLEGSEEEEINADDLNTEFKELVATHITQHGTRQVSYKDDSFGDQVFPESFKLSFSSNLDLDSIIDTPLHQPDEEEEEHDGYNELVSIQRKELENLDPTKQQSIKLPVTKTPLNSLITQDEPPVTSTPGSNCVPSLDTLNVISDVESARSSPISKNSSHVEPINDGFPLQQFLTSPQNEQQEEEQHYRTKPYISFPVERGLRLVTAGSSIEHRLLSYGSQVLNIAPVKTDSIQGSIFGSPLLDTPCNDTNTNQNSETFEDIKSSFNLKTENESATEFIHDDRLNKYDEAKLPINKASPSALLHNDAAMNAGTAVYPSTLLVELLANDNFDRNFPSTTSSSSVEPRPYIELRNKEDWVKSLNSAFEIDEDLIGELEGISHFMPFNDQQNTPEVLEEEGERNMNLKEDHTALVIEKVKMKMEPVLSPLSIKKRNPKSAKSPLSALPMDNLPPQPQGATSAVSQNNDRVFGFFNKISARIASASSQFVKSSSHIYPEKAQRYSPEPDPDQPSELMSGGANGSVSSPGTVTAKLFEENGIEVKKALSHKQMHFVETIQSPRVVNEKASQKFNNKEKNDEREGVLLETDKETANNLQSRIERSEPSNHWKPNNRFMDFNSKNSIHRRKTKIFTFKYKESPIPDEIELIPPHATHSEQSVKPAWKTSLFKTKSAFKRRTKSRDISMDSGVSLEGFAAEYARVQEFENIELTNQFLSREIKDARKILEMTNLENEGTKGFVQMSNGLPITRGSELDSESSNETLGSHLEEKLSFPKPLTKYVKSPMPKHERSLSVFYRKKHLSLSFMKKNKSADNIGSIGFDATVRFAPTPEYRINTRNYDDDNNDEEHVLKDSTDNGSKQHSTEPPKSILQRPNSEPKTKTKTKTNHKSTGEVKIKSRGRSLLHRIKTVYGRK